tara:strand:+ start:24998 stop:27370 length:2373 start_codon:yes stop_codon:yes gene_type:complete
MSNKLFVGHSANGSGAGTSEELRLHIQRVVQLAEQFSAPLRLDKAAGIAAVLHDIGKYSYRFQNYIAGQPGAGSPDHWSAGARLSLAATGGMAIARTDMRDAIRMVIECHHSGLNVLRWPSESGKVLDEHLNATDRLICGDLPLLMKRFLDDGLSIDTAAIEKLPTPPASAMLETRMLFSCLVDADFLATEAHFAGDRQEGYRPRPEPTPMDFAAALRHLDAKMRDLPLSKPAIQELRRKVSDDCFSAASRSVGTYTLTAPTGAGKTLSMLRFALRHAIEHSLSRLVFVMPFLTIVDQTVETLRWAFCDLQGFNERWILEDHSLADHGANDESVPDYVANQKRLAAENWDAPIVLTSSVKCLESIHANRTSTCRKLHRLGRSVLLFDEVQTIPPSLASLTLATLQYLSKRFGSTIVLATATQPAFDMLDSDDVSKLPTMRTVTELAGGSWKPDEIIEDADGLFAASSGRVSVRWELETEIELDEFGRRIAATDQSAIAIVNLKRHAVELFESLKQTGVEAYHLSTSMCAAHRKRTLQTIRTKLASDQPIKLVSTQCVEAGVDLSFAEGYRSLAPLTSIAQAAGRVNRSGERDGPSAMTVFCPVTIGNPYPPGYASGIAALQMLLAAIRGEGHDPNEIDIISSPAWMRQYYEFLYTHGDETAMSETMCEGLDGLNFEIVQKEYRLIKQDQINVLVPFDLDAQAELLDRYLDDDKPPRWTRDWFRDARPHTVSIYRQDFGKLSNFIQPLPFGGDQHASPDEADWWFLPADQSHRYDPEIGLVVPQELEFLGV